ncbi:amidase family protein [Streptomyces sp. NBC_00076]|uniref:amidase family protein n=1 Tax=Streptomyces sp. NBC_00076 TaxID=2975642 RepID=UPI00386F5142
MNSVRHIEELLDRVERTAGMGAFVTLAAARALAEAHEADRSPPRGPPHGLPPAVKDNIHVAGLQNTAGSRVLADFWCGSALSTAPKAFSRSASTPCTPRARNSTSPPGPAAASTATSPTSSAPRPTPPLVYADIELDEIVIARNASDPAGHYARPDATCLVHHREPRRAVVPGGDRGNLLLAGGFGRRVRCRYGRSARKRQRAGRPQALRSDPGPGAAAA